ncbi:MAG TPA: lipid-A-disaccharide synthase [Candidatus Sulfotelmatobacter sp.]|nr:lipid-A-disaccharide synthase [Candidatus Sulfotelmatobacter sp.]
MADPPPVAPPRTIRIMLVAGEPSGDAIGARLMAALKLRTLGKVAFSGIGGARMAEQGLASRVPLAELSVMGLVEVLPRVPNLLRRLRETADFALAERPDAVVSIDAPGFSFRLARRLAGRGIPLVHVVAPTVWAWRPGRARTIARFLDHLLVLLPFEPPYFEREGLATTFVGHPVLDSGADRGQGAAFRARHGIAAKTPLLAVLPGSRAGEVSRLLPVFGETLALLRQRIGGLQAVVPTLAPVAGTVRQAAAQWPVPTAVLAETDEKYDAMAASQAALAASGTVALELALADVPAVVAYRVHPVTAFLARRLVRVRYANLVNILLDRPVVPELLQQDCVPSKLAEAVERVMIDEAARAAQHDAALSAMRLLGRDDQAPSLRAADAILRAIALGPRRRGTV